MYSIIFLFLFLSILYPNTFSYLYYKLILLKDGSSFGRVMFQARGGLVLFSFKNYLFCFPLCLDVNNNYFVVFWYCSLDCLLNPCKKNSWTLIVKNISTRLLRWFTECETIILFNPFTLKNCVCVKPSVLFVKQRCNRSLECIIVIKCTNCQLIALKILTHILY